MKTNTRMWAQTAALLMCFLCARAARAQETGGQESTVTATLRGRVLNKITNEPIARALVTTNGNEYATMTNDRGQFEIKIVEKFMTGSPGATQVVSRLAEAKKPGFLQGRKMGTWQYPEAGPHEPQSEMTIYLSPEALIIGHVNVPGSEGDLRIECELYRRRLQDGHMAWSSVERFTSWTDGEFRFSGLEAGTYKLITHEQMDFESVLPMPGAPLFGYPPIYYPNTTDFSAASPIVLHAGETVQLNLTVARRQYYPVHIPVADPPTAGGLDLNVHPIGHRSPGWSLGYNPADEAIEGMLPDGTYTVEASGFGGQHSSGMVNFTLRGAPAEGTPLRLVPDAPLTVTVREEFQSQPDGPHMMTMTDRGPRRMPDVQVSLISMEEFQSFSGFRHTRRAEGSDEHTLILENVGPGRYRVRVASSRGYASSVQSGGTDLLHEPLLVGLGGGNPPIEITMRDDGGEISGTVEETKGSRPSSQTGDVNGPVRFVYLLPLGDSFIQYPPVTQFRGEDFQLQQVPPGSYLVLAYPDAQADVPYGDDEAVQALKSKGQVIRVEAGQKISVRAKMITEGAEE